MMYVRWRNTWTGDLFTDGPYQMSSFIVGCKDMYN